ncbi:MAG: hypothetical protein V9E89_02445 [Ilumatobacteraceae bacterium]
MTTPSASSPPRPAQRADEEGTQDLQHRVPLDRGQQDHDPGPGQQRGGRAVQRGQADLAALEEGTHRRPVVGRRRVVHRRFPRLIIGSAGRAARRVAH